MLQCFKYFCCCSKMRDNFVQIELNKTTWDIPGRYQNLSPVGSGAYGQVINYFHEGVVKIIYSN